MTPWLLIAFITLVGTLVILDLRLVTRRPRIVESTEALASFFLWVVSAFLFGFFVHFVYETNVMNLEAQVSFPIADKPINLDGDTAWLQFLTVYVVELALSLDNIAIMALLIAYFRIPPSYVGRTLFWSLLISLVLRLMMIMGAAWLLRVFGWAYWVLGGLLVLAMLRTLILPGKSADFRSRWPARPLLKFFRVTEEHRGQKLFGHVDGRWAITPIMLVVLLGGTMDATYAFDSVPAVFSVTRDPFLAYTGSMFAVLALRSLYFALAGVVGRFRYLRISMVFVLLCVAGKMFMDDFGHQATIITLVTVASIILIGVAASAIRNRALDRSEPLRDERPSPLEDLADAVEITRRNLRKVVILIAGTFVVVIGIAIAPLPGPGPVILVPIGLGLLATEFIWARRLLKTLREQSDMLQRRADAVITRTSILIVPVIVIAYWSTAAALFVGLAIEKRTVFWTVAASVFLPVGVWATRAILRWRRERANAPSTSADPRARDDSAESC